MSTFPQEILDKIFIHLPLIQKQECMLVCRSWRKIIYTRSLFHTVIIDAGNVALFSKFMEMIKKTSSFGAQVQYLKLPTGFKDDFDKSKLLYFFPKLRVLDSEEVIRFTSKEMCELNIEHFDQTSLPSQMECVEESGNLEMIRLLATSGLGTHLVKLQLNLIHLTVPFSLDDAAPQLKNLPSLRSLDILTYHITMDNCETLHANIPSLKCLYLENSDWTHIENGFDRRRKIEAAPLVTSFFMHMSNLNIPNQNNWFQYIQRKYPNLEAFGFSVPLLSYDKELVDHYHQVNLPMVLQGLGSRLTSVRLLDVDIDTTIFSKLDQFGCKIKDLTLDYVKESVTTALSRSNQINYIENLTINNLSSESLDWLKSMKKIKSLSFKSMEVDFDNMFDSSDKVVIKLETLLQSCPETVELIDASGLHLKYDTETVQQQHQQLSVKKLILNDISNAKGLDTLFSNYLPHLKYLILGSAKKTLSFPNHHFDYIEISSKHTSFGVNVTLKTLIDNKIRYYNTSNIRSRVGYLQLGDYITPLSEDDFDDEDHIKIVCGSVKALKLRGFQAYLI